MPGYTKDVYSGGCLPQAGGGQERCECDPRGSLSPACSVSGNCQCRDNVEGRNCDQCRPGTFGLHQVNPGGCLKCFCSGVTDQCTEASLYWSTLRMPIYDNSHGFSLTDKRQGLKKDRDLQLGQSGLQYEYSASDRRTYYWQLPAQFLGNRLAAYGGNLTIFQQFSTRSQTGVPLIDSDVIMLGNGLSLHYNVAGERIPDQEERLKVPVYEDGWVIMRGNTKIPATREDFLRVLSDIDSILVRATICRDMESSSISRVNMDIAVGQQTGGPPAVGGEECQCPPGYRLDSSGRKCEDQDECQTFNFCGNGTCSNLRGGFQCECSPGYGPGRDGRCEDLNECLDPSQGHQCAFRCHNTVGSYRCVCPYGYELDSDGRHCKGQFSFDISFS